jgi:CrcB protein
VTVLLVFAGGAVGAPSRYLLDRLIQSRHRLRFPVGTLAVNVLGCLLLGAVAGSADAPDWAVLLLGTGFCGGFTTFSTFSVEAVDLAAAGRWGGIGRAAGYVALSLALGLGAAAAGAALTGR